MDIGNTYKNLVKIARDSGNILPDRQIHSSQYFATALAGEAIKLKPGIVASYNIRPRNGECLFCFQHFINL